MPPVLIRIKDIKIDDGIYPRNSLDAMALARMRRAVQTGAILPPIVLEKKTRTLLDGRHRLEIVRNAKALKIPALLEAHGTRAEMFLRAIALNALHGEALDTLDYAQCTIRAQTLGIADEDLALVLSVPVEYIAVVRGGTTAVDSAGNWIPIKRPLSRFAQTKLSVRQTAGNACAVGLPQVAMVNQVINLFENDLIDLGNAGLVDRLRVLKKHLKVIK